MHIRYSRRKVINFNCGKQKQVHKLNANPILCMLTDEFIFLSPFGNAILKENALKCLPLEIFHYSISPAYILINPLGG